jgi:hypothetical protein
MKLSEAQATVREASPGFLANFNGELSGKSAPYRTAGNGYQYEEAQEACRRKSCLPDHLPSTLAELAEALRHPIPYRPARLPYKNALEAFAACKPLTMEMVRDLMAKERAAREVIMKEYTERTGQAVDYCEECDLGVVEEEIEEKYGTRVDATHCEVCDGLGVRIL